MQPQREDGDDKNMRWEENLNIENKYNYIKYNYIFLRSLTKVEFPWETLFSVTKPLHSHTKRLFIANVLHSLEKLCIYTAVPQGTLCSLTKLLHLPQKLCACSQKFCTPQRNFVFDHKTSVFTSLQNLCLHEKLCIWSQNFCVHQRAKPLFAWETLYLITQFWHCPIHFLLAHKTFAFAKNSLAKKVFWVNANVSVESFIKALW